MPIESAADLFDPLWWDDYNEVEEFARNFDSLHEPIVRMLARAHQGGDDQSAERVMAVVVSYTVAAQNPNRYVYTMQGARWSGGWVIDPDGLPYQPCANELEVLNTATVVRGWISVDNTFVMKPVPVGMPLEIYRVPGETDPVWSFVYQNDFVCNAG